MLCNVVATCDHMTGVVKMAPGICSVPQHTCIFCIDIPYTHFGRHSFADLTRFTLTICALQIVLCAYSCFTLFCMFIRCLIWMSFILHLDIRMELGFVGGISKLLMTFYKTIDARACILSLYMCLFGPICIHGIKIM